MLNCDVDVAFIVGSPRSGTTILGQCLENHPDIAHFYEPYYVWDYHIGIREHDIKDRQYVTEKIKTFVRNKFYKFGKKSKVKLIIDKSPEHCFAIPYVREVFPRAKWIHILRDGRDVVLSISKKWKKRQNWVEKRSYRQFFEVLKTSFNLQPYWYFRFLQIWYELKSGKSLSPNFYLNKSKWKGQVGWGPRFPGWDKFLQKHSVLEFNAQQWVECIKHIYKYLPSIPDDKLLELRYEALVTNPREQIEKILNFLGVLGTNNFWDSLPALNVSNTQKWKNEFSAMDLKKIAPIITPALIDLRYESDPQWWEGVLT